MDAGRRPSIKLELHGSSMDLERFSEPLPRVGRLYGFPWNEKVQSSAFLEVHENNVLRRLLASTKKVDETSMGGIVASMKAHENAGGSSRTRKSTCEAPASVHLSYLPCLHELSRDFHGTYFHQFPWMMSSPLLCSYIQRPKLHYM